MRFILIFIFIISLPIVSSAHTLVLLSEDLEDGTILVTGKFSTGQSVSGAKVRLIAKNNRKILFEKRLPDEGEIIIKIPDEPYEIVLDGGPGHKVVKSGIEPSGGFKISYKDKTQTKISFSAKTIALSLSVFIIITSFFCGFLSIKKIKNHNPPFI